MKVFIVFDHKDSVDAVYENREAAEQHARIVYGGRWNEYRVRVEPLDWIIEMGLRMEKSS